jgi:capsular polysaccharide transport system permease protein
LAVPTFWSLKAHKGQPGVPLWRADMRNLSGERATPAGPGIFEAVRRYSQIILALLQQEQEARRRHPLESILDLLEPAALVALLCVLWSVLDRRASVPLGDSPILFVSAGLFLKFYWITLSKNLKRSVESLGRRFPVERRLDYILVHIILKTFDFTLLAVFGFGIIFIFFTEKALPYNWAAIFESITLVIMLGFGWGTLSMVLSSFFWPWAYIVPLFNRMMLLFSGIFYIADFLPPDVRYILSFNPLLHAIILFRTGFYTNQPTLVLDMNYLISWAIAMVFLGFVIERVTVRSERE